MGDPSKKKCATLYAGDGYCTLSECPPGLFLFKGRTIGLKTEYGSPPFYEVFCADSGEYFWGGTDDAEDRAVLKVLPLVNEISTDV